MNDNDLKKIDDLMNLDDDSLKEMGKINGAYGEQPTEVDLALRDVFNGIVILRKNFSDNETLVKITDVLLDEFQVFLKNLYEILTQEKTIECNCEQTDSIPVEKLNLKQHDISTIEDHGKFSDSIPEQSKQKAKDIIDNI